MTTTNGLGMNRCESTYVIIKSSNSLIKLKTINIKMENNVLCELKSSLYIKSWFRFMFISFMFVACWCNQRKTTKILRPEQIHQQ